jgi:uncharacterized GH25 family protein
MRGSVRGRFVRADTGAPVPGAAITIVRGPGPAPDIAPLTDSNGNFGLDELIEGDWHLRAQGAGDEIGEEVVIVFDNSLTDVTITVGKGKQSERWVSLRGRVVRADTGAPVPDAAITIVRAPGFTDEPGMRQDIALIGSPTIMRQTDSAGRFVVHELSAGDWHLEVRSPEGHIGEEVVTIVDDSPSDVTIRLTINNGNPKRGRIRGRVVRADTGAPVGRATVSIVRGTPDLTLLTDLNGSFLLDELLAGDWHLEVRSPEGQVGENVVHVEGNSVTDATISLRMTNGGPAMQRGRIRGRVVRADTGAPVADAAITIVRGPGPAPDIAPLTDSNGNFALDDLPAGDWQLRAQTSRGEIGDEVVTVFDNSLADVTIRVSRSRTPRKHGKAR